MQCLQCSYCIEMRLSWCVCVCTGKHIKMRADMTEHTRLARTKSENRGPHPVLAFLTSDLRLLQHSECTQPRSLLRPTVCLCVCVCVCVCVWLVAGNSTWTRDTCLHVLVLRLLHRLWIFLHTQSFHRRHYRQLQHAEEEGFESSFACHCVTQW